MSVEFELEGDKVEAAAAAACAADDDDEAGEAVPDVVMMIS
jgi:hypothetical protein